MFPCMSCHASASSDTRVQGEGVLHVSIFQRAPNTLNPGPGHREVIHL